MCRANVTRAAAQRLGPLLVEMGARLAAEHGLDPAGVTIGPVDFGPEALTGHGEGEGEAPDPRPVNPWWPLAIPAEPPHTCQRLDIRWPFRNVFLDVRSCGAYPTTWLPSEADPDKGGWFCARHCAEIADERRAARESAQ